MNEAKTTASLLAKHIIAECNANGKTISNLKLQKLLYYAQAWHLAFENKPLFTDRIEAWVHGPVVPNVFREYREFKWSPLTAQCADRPSTDVFQHAKKVIDAYGDFDASQLERMTHREDPWLEARAGLPDDVGSTREISWEAMRKYFSARLDG
jgi:uncharacterized phage-associated protein